MRRLALLLFAVAILVGSLSILFSELRLGTYGLVHSLSPAYFVALFLLTVSFLIALKYDGGNRLLLVAHLFVVTILLYLIAALLEGTARFPYVYHVYGHTDFIIRHGSIDTSLTYQSWPALQYLGAATVQVMDLGPTGLLIAYPIIIKLLALPVLYLVLRYILDDSRIVWLTLWIYLVAGWVNQQYYTAHSFGYLAFLLIVLLMLLVVMRKYELGTVRGGALFVMFAILFAAIATGHLLSSIVALASLGAVYILLKLKRVSGFGFVMPVCLAAILAVWLFNPGGYLSDSLFSTPPSQPDSGIIDNGQPGNDGSIIEPPSPESGGATRPAPGTPWDILMNTISGAFGHGSEHTRVMYVKAAFTGVFCLLALLGLLYVIVKKKLDFRLGILIAVITGILASMLFVGEYSGEIVSRVLSYSLPILAVFAALTMRSRILRVAGFAFLCVAPLLFVVAAYGNERFDYVSPAEIAGVEHYHAHTSAGNRVQSFHPRILDMRNIEWYAWRGLSPDLLCRPSQSGRVFYVLRGERDIEGYEYMVRPVDIDKLDEIYDCRYYAQVYGSDGFDLFWR